MRKQKKHKKPSAMDSLKKLVADAGDETGGRYARVLKSTRHENLQELIVDTKDSNLRIAYYIGKNNVIHLLCGADKRGQDEAEFYKRLIAEADVAIDEIKLKESRPTTKH